MISIQEAINNFYKEKSKYESLLEKNKKEIIKNKELSWKEKRLEYKKLKPKCINCKRPVGSIFTIKYNTDTNYGEKYRVLRATCGDRVSPCNFNININAGSYKSVITNFKNENESLQNYKLKIIDEKNKLLFGYISTEDAIEQFDELKAYISDSSDLLSYYYKEYNDVFDNEEKKAEMKQLLTTSYLLINEIKTAIQEFKNTNNAQYCKDAVTMYVEQLKPQLDQLFKLKYSASFVDFDSKYGVYSLIQKKHTIKDIERANIEPSIISYEKGIAEVPKNKTKKIQPVSSNATRKQKLIIEEESEGEKSEGEDVNNDSDN
jgi:hypothetical protein